MRETEYAYGVARIRANELTLLSAAEIDRLVAASGYKEALRILADNGWAAPEKGTDLTAMLEAQSRETWALLTEVVPDIRELDSLIITNDFFNLKAALKATFSDDEPYLYTVTPSVHPPETICEAAATKRFELLPAYMQAPAEEAYDAIVRLESGRLADIFLDTAALNTRLDLAAQTGNALLKDITRTVCASANIKTAVRCARLGKDAAFMRRAMCRCASPDADRIAETALTGINELTAYLAVSFSEDAAEALKAGEAAFEKWSDEAVVRSLQSAVFTPFGIEPFAAYFVRRELEIKNVRIILATKLNNIPAEQIRKRVRDVYA